MDYSISGFGFLSYALNSTLGSVLVIVLILISYIRLYSIDRYMRTTFNSLLVFCITAIACDMAILLLEGIFGAYSDDSIYGVDGIYGTVGRFYFTFLYLFNALHYLFQILSCYYIMVFIDYMTFKRTYRTGKVLKAAYIIVISYALILLLSFSLEVIFNINNDYYTKIHFYVRLIINFFPLCYALGELITYRSLFKKSQVITFFTLPTLFLIGLSLDLFFHSARLIWPCITAALLYAYFFMVQSHVSIDPLTETGNRLSFNEFTDKLFRSATGESWAIVMIDMDHFKHINDTLGHQEGDNALGYMAEIIKSCIKKDDFVARYGGDEFVLATKVEKETAENTIISLMNEINIVINIFNEREICPFKLAISYGYDVYTADGKHSIDEFLHHIDNLMYKNKHERRRSGDVLQEAAV